MNDFIVLSVSTVLKFCRCWEEIIPTLHSFIMYGHTHIYGSLGIIIAAHFFACQSSTHSNNRTCLCLKYLTDGGEEESVVLGQADVSGCRLLH